MHSEALTSDSKGPDYNYATFFLCASYFLAVLFLLFILFHMIQYNSIIWQAWWPDNRLFLIYLLEFRHAVDSSACFNDIHQAFVFYG